MSTAHGTTGGPAVLDDGALELLEMIGATLPRGSRVRLHAAGGNPERSDPPEEETPAAGHRLELDWHGGDGSPVLVVELAEPMATAQRVAWEALARRTIDLHLATIRATARVQALEKSEQLQQALYEIADLAGSTLELTEMLKRIHDVVARLMYAENFYIVLYDEARQIYRFLYFADQLDPYVADPAVEIAVESAPNSLTLALIRHGQAMLGSSELVRLRLGVDYDLMHGPESADWLGVTMRREEIICGAVVVQSYDRPHCYGNEELALLVYVAQHILTALDRHQAREELERRVEGRTRELQLSNIDLQAEIEERQRAERLQRALFRIAELSITTDTLERFYAQVHAVVGELLYAHNFYIALLSDDGQWLEFPYSIDERDANRVSRRLGSGMTEHVIATGRALLTHPLRNAGLRGRGTIAHCWLGVPLYRDNRVVGVIAVQSYSHEMAFSDRDQDLLTFVANHISIALARKQEQERLVIAHAELEQRVESRTRELAMANGELLEQIGERLRAEQQLTHQALHDDLTGLPNRSQLLNCLASAVTTARTNARHSELGETARAFAVLFLDLDRFKLVNDSVGHSAGDELLVLLSVQADLAHRVAGHRRGLVGVVVGEDQLGGRPVGPLGPQLHRPGSSRTARPPQDEVGQAHHLGRRAVVAHELDRARGGVSSAEAEQVLGGCAGEGVDGLRRVAHDAQVAAVAEPQLEQCLLEPVHVLVLVHDEVAVLRAHRTGDRVVLTQDSHHEEEHVLEVDDAAVGLDVLVGGHETGHGRGIQPAGGDAACSGGGRGIRLGGEHRDLGPLDLGGEVTDGGAVEPEPEPTAGLGHRAGLVRHDLRRGAAHGLGPEVVQLPQRRSMEGAGLHAPDAEVAQPGAHLSGRPRGEGDGKHPLGLVAPGEHAVGDAVGDGASLSGAGPGQHAHRARGVRRHLPLLRVERVEDGIGSGVNGQAGHHPDPRCRLRRRSRRAGKDRPRDGVPPQRPAQRTSSGPGTRGVR